jgi:hypothetical protein
MRTRGECRFMRMGRQRDEPPSALRCWQEAWAETAVTQGAEAPGTPWEAVATE